MFTVNGLTLREIRTSDAQPLVQNLFNDARVAPLITDFVVPKGPNMQQGIIQAMQSPQIEICCIVEDGRPVNERPKAARPKSGRGWKEGDEPVFVGMVSLASVMDRSQRSSEFAIALIPEYWGNGYGTAITRFILKHAFEELNMHRVSLNVWEENERARKVYEYVGFTNEGMKREVRYSQGKRRGMVTMGYLRHEWEAAQAKSKPN